MKKLYLFFAALIACSTIASAQAMEVVINVTGASNINSYLGEAVPYGGEFDLDKVQKVELVDGENKISIPEDYVFYAAPIKPDDIFSFTDRDGDKVSMGYTSQMYELRYSSWSNYSPYTLICQDEASYRNRSVTITMDDCSKVKITRGDNKVFEPTENTITIPYNPELESNFIIAPLSDSYTFYQVMAGDDEIKKDSGNSYYKVDVAELAEGETINVITTFPDGFKYKTTISVEGPIEMIKYIKLNGEDIADIAAYLTEDGFEADPMTIIAIGIDDKLYNITELSDNGVRKYNYSQLTINGIDCDHNIVIKGEPIAVYNVKFNIIGAEGVVFEFNYNPYDIVEGENILKATSKANYVSIQAAKGWEVESFTDSEGHDYLDDYYWTAYGSASANIEDGVEYNIVAKKITRENQIVVYFEDYETKNLWFDYFVCGFENYVEPTDDIMPGYNLINFRDEDGYFQLYATNYSGAYDRLIVYKNDELTEPAYDTAKYREDENVANDDVYKVFFDNDPGYHTVTFVIEDDALAGYEVKKDIITEVNFSAPVKAVGPTRFTISPVGCATESLTVKIGDNEIEPIDGSYTFETYTDTNIEVKGAKSPTTSIDNILTEDNATADVYTIQGIRILRSAKAADIKVLPAGLYIVNGNKVIVK